MEVLISGEEATEREIIERVQNGSKEDFRLLVAAHQSRIFAAIVRQGVERSIAMELSQEVFLKAFLNIGSFRFEARFSTWLLRIAVNHTSSYFASKRFKQRKRTVPLDETWYEQSRSGFDEDGYDLEALKRLKQAAAQLPPKYREVLVLCGFEQRPYQEAASLLGIPVGTVRSRLHKARCMAKELYFTNDPLTGEKG